MKKSLLFFIAVFTSLVAFAGFNPLINKNGTYVPFNEKTDIVAGFKQTDKCPKGSFNYYRSCLGYSDGDIVVGTGAWVFTKIISHDNYSETNYEYTEGFLQ